MNVCALDLRRLVIPLGMFIAFSLATSEAQPLNDMFANRLPLSGTNTVTTGSSVGATLESGEPIIEDVPGGASVWWTWTATSSDIATISTAGSSFDTLLGVYTGSSVSGLNYVASNDDDPDSSVLTSKVVFQATAGQTYEIAVDGYWGEFGAVRLQIQLAPPAPPAPPAPAPAWLLPDPNGHLVNSASFTGKVVMVNFWATWCVPCKVEMPDLVALQEMYRADGFVIVGPDTGWSGDTPPVVQNFLATFTPTINYQVVMASAAMMQAFGNIDAIPTTFIIDRQNLIRKKFIGTQSRSTFEKEIVPLLYGNTRLVCRQNGNELVFSWPTTAATFTLESAPRVQYPVWTKWPVTPMVVDGSNTVHVPLSASQGFFRLRMPNN